MSTKAPISLEMVPMRLELSNELWHKGMQTGAERRAGGQHASVSKRAASSARGSRWARSHGRNGATTALDAVLADTWVRLRAVLALARPVRSTRTVPKLSPRGALIHRKAHGSAGAAARPWSLLDGTDRDDLEVELSICPLRIDAYLCDRALCLAARANLRVLRRAAKYRFKAVSCRANITHTHEYSKKRRLQNEAEVDGTDNTPADCVVVGTFASEGRVARSVRCDNKTSSIIAVQNPSNPNRQQ